MRRNLAFLFLASLLLASSASTAAGWQQARPEDAAETQARIDAISRELERRQSAMEQRSKQMSLTERELQQLEMQISTVANELAQTTARLAQTNQRIGALEQQQSTLESEQRQQAKWLAKQLNMAYRIGEHDFLKLVLNQENPADFERLHGYYGYFNRARLEKLDELKATQAQLAQVMADLAAARNDIAAQQQEQKRQQGVLREQQKEQQQLIGRLQQQQQQDQSRVAQLQQDQEELEQVLAAIIAALRDEPQLDGLAKLKGDLNWPAQGKVQNLFGRTRSGGVKWKGTLIDAAAGSPVRAIADGRVIFANWMRGYGLLLVLDHGDGYMSLYGHNQTILPNVGEVVRRGEEIGLVGQSGGRESPALYLEIRVKGEAVNPAQWCR
ncbi:murein hydrolase activator EnvC family protein [Pseudidiomarina terrestris]|uniref:Peptidoglycan DD-metalloendopeptidase family protein n=1 Tax=Pseudidiomarina terrestris TaxID=2820060 RepID=A0AAW7R4I8_9GAMM|nr:MULTISPECIES: peptidoglycan DD-metalloendopeptidase family protein [unclassified Pseudidiomarina]MDN7125590.1 peptidoglycan DD-metalloendopeptidase family protein [Pseudidiomarina sp. 1APP75-32.1]MDN7130547.1 peptidoglycan DD-metalloendopeptidase family protein [Pseudidiomarina sp. 1APR75-15]MDN7134188.1 peptidoglycan DD-metalloendopeptidase family protein [Pseudidiomarina sp. 1ASP75-5]MDN7137125.1 peptidoglycan DD-metalloendopeptidase family protein [Pseudidiomarina sp. 1ASP75-14]